MRAILGPTGQLRRLTACALSAAVLFACPPDAVALDNTQLRELLEHARVEMKMPGLRAAVRTADGGTITAAVGLADVEASIPLDDLVGMPGGSTGKMFVATLAMLLVEDGTLSLDDPVGQWLDDTPWYQKLPNSDEIQVRHLLSHTAGIADYPGTIRFRLAMIGRVIRNGSAYFEPEELIGFVLGRRPLFPVGQGYRYTDAGYLVLGRVIEAATGRDYYDLLEERILDPLELDGVRPALSSVLTDIAPGYMGGARNLKKDGRMKFDPRSEWTGGGLITTPAMLTEFVAALAEGRIVKPDSLTQMLNGGWHDPDEPGYHYGLGLFVFDKDLTFGHGGLWPGYRTHVLHFRTTGTTIAVQTNRDGRIKLRTLVMRIAAQVKEN